MTLLFPYSKWYWGDYELSVCGDRDVRSVIALDIKLDQFSNVCLMNYANFPHSWLLSVLSVLKDIKNRLILLHSKKCFSTKLIGYDTVPRQM